MDCSYLIFEYSQDDPCLLNKIKSWLHGRVHPTGNYNFYNDPPKLDGQIGVPYIIDNILDMIGKYENRV